MQKGYWKGIWSKILKTQLVFLITGLVFIKGYSQDILINEIQSSNISTISDHTGDTPDWIELYNPGNLSVNLENYGLTDNDSIPLKWTFPATIIGPQSHLLVFASGLDLKAPALHWETIVDLGDEWAYWVPQSEVEGNWRDQSFDDSQWPVNISSFGYGDGDDSTIIENPISIYLRKVFEITDPNNVSQAYLHIDYDDAFVAYLNGVEIARSNIGQPGIIPAFDTPADNYDHEAVMYQGGQPEKYLIENVVDYISAGINVLAIQVHNHSTTSSDLTAIPFFTLGYSTKPNKEIETSAYIDFMPIGLHTNFKISASGEPIILSDASGILIDSVFSGGIGANISLGRKPDGSLEWKFFDSPTPGMANNTKGYEPVNISEVTCSIEGGLFTSGIILKLGSKEIGDSIFYTLDGSDPNTNSLLYSSAIAINSSRVLKARVIKNGFLPGAINTQTYIINADHDLPVICVNTDPYNLWNNDYGIYTMGDDAQSDFPHFGANFWEDWERPGNITMYKADGSLAFKIDAGIKIFGNWSRGHPQKSLSIHCRKSYGYDGIYYKLFPDKDISFFKTIVLRNSGNDFNNTMFRDALCNRIVASKNIDQQAYRPAVVYLNGQYWGILNIREKVNEEFISSNHVVDEDLVDLLENDGYAIRGSADHYEEMISFINENSISNKSNYDYVRTQMDISNFIQYQVAEIFIDNRDWPGNNIKFWRERTQGSRWKWIMFDSDFGLNTWGDNNQEFNTLDYALEPNGPGWPNPPWSTFLLRNLIKNASFKYEFINTFADNLNTIFDPRVMNNQMNEMVGNIDGEIKDHLNRWNGSINYWENRISAMRSFINERRNNVRNHIRTTFKIPGTYNLNIDVRGNGQIGLNTLSLTEFPWDGVYFDDIPIQLQALPGPGHRFIEWEGIEMTGQEKLSLSPQEAVNITAVFEPINENISSIVINEINYNNAEDFDTGDWVELLNAGEYSVNISDWVLKDDDDLHEYVFPEGTVIHAHDFLVVCRNKKKFQTKYPLIDISEGELSFGFGSNSDCVRLFSDTGELKDIVCYEDGLPWPEEASGFGATLALKDAFSNNDYPGNWEASLDHGTPGAKNTDIITSISDIQEQIPSIKVYPNPAKAIVYLELYSDKEKNVTIEMVDITGSKCLSLRDRKVKVGKNEIFISLKSYQSIVSGLYLLQVRSKYGIQRVKFLVSR